MRVKTLRTFMDLKENKERKAGDTFKVSQERFKELNSTKYGTLVEELKDEKVSDKND